ncbi:MAG: hypothetical protein HY367_02440 [Candidatus Aenigmarchaeota archaeon]|nr:hypothetical protein [Candidatus Aenigmarchaeota archaeon]
MFTIAFAFAGIAIVLFSLSVIANEYLEHRHRALEERFKATIEKRAEGADANRPPEKMNTLDELLAKRKKKG